MKFAIGITALLAAVPLHPLSRQTPTRPSVQIPVDDTREAYQPTVPVSGVTRVGIMSGDPKGVVNMGHLTVLLPTSAPKGDLCVKILSADGQYEGRLKVPRSKWPAASGPIDLKFTPKFAPQLKGRLASDLAIETMISESCEDGAGQAVVSSWLDPITDRDFWVMVNSGHVHTEVAAVIGGETKTFGCEPVDAARKVAFDVRCHVQLPTGSNPTRLDIVRTRLGSTMAPVPVPIRW